MKSYLTKIEKGGKDLKLFSVLRQLILDIQCKLNADDLYYFAVLAPSVRAGQKHSF